MRVGDIERLPRRRLPWRREGEAIEVEFEDMKFTVVVGRYPGNGRPGEIFVNGAKPGSSLDRLLAAAAVVLSLLLQAGADPAGLGQRLGRLENGEPASVIGAAPRIIVAGEDRTGG